MEPIGSSLDFKLIFYSCSLSLSVTSPHPKYFVNTPKLNKFLTNLSSIFSLFQLTYDISI